MGFSNENIFNVKATGFPLGMGRYSSCIDFPGLILVSWRSSVADMLFQVYVDGTWAGVTFSCDQRKMLVPCGHTRTVAIEILGVDPADQYVDYSCELSSFTNDKDGGYVKLTWPQKGNLPWGSKIEIYGDNGSGVIDYDEPLYSRNVWLHLSEKWGWGLDAMGRGDFGFSGTGAVGWGHGGLGRGEFGFDALIQSFSSEVLSPGLYQFAIRVVDSCGNYNSEDDTICQVYADPLPAGADLSIENYDEQNDQLRLCIV